MRKGIKDSQFYMENEIFTGVSLGWDFTSEHEWGIKGINRGFGLKSFEEGFLGVENRKIRVCPEGLRLIECKYKNTNYVHLIYQDHWFSEYDGSPVEPIDHDKDYVTAWREGAFGISVKKDKVKKEQLKELYEAFQKKDVGIMFIGGKAFGNSSLFLGILSKMDKADLELMYDVDYDRKLLLEAAKKTGIEDKLSEAGKVWFSLSPKWSKEMKSNNRGEVKTEFDVIFWLNPRDQKESNSGWFTIEDLNKWAYNLGPVPKNPDRNNSLNHILD